MVLVVQETHAEMNHRTLVYEHPKQGLLKTEARIGHFIIRP
jgi:hypothetical protein